MASATSKFAWKVKKMENNYQLSRIHNYVSGLMSKEEMHTLEREALDDPFLQDAIEGYSMHKGVDARQLSLLQKRLHARVEEHTSTKTKQLYSWQRLAIGLTAAVIFVAVSTLFFLRDLSRPALETQEVIIGDQLFDYEIVERGEARPADGWESLQTLLNSHYANANAYTGELQISFTIVRDRITDLQIVGEGYHKDEELENLIRNNLQWKGEKGQFKIQITALKE